MARRYFRASSAAQFIQCPGSANLPLVFEGWIEPEPRTKGAAVTGTKIHDALLEPLAELSPELLARYAEVADRLAPLFVKKRNVLYTDDVKLHDFLDVHHDLDPLSYVTLMDWVKGFAGHPPKVIRYVRDVCETLQEIMHTHTDGGPAEIYAEVNVKASWTPSNPGCTPDLVVTHLGATTMDVIDYKTGAIKVSPEENAQLLFYAACYLLAHPLIQTYRLHIMQPDNFDVWEVTRKYLMEWTNIAIEADRKILAQDLTLQAGDACTFCPANPHTRAPKGNIVCPVKMEELYPTPPIDESIFDL